MEENPLLVLLVNNEAKTLGIIEKAHDTFALVIGHAGVFLAGYANDDIFGFNGFFLRRIGWCGDNITVLIHVGQHVFQALAALCVFAAFALAFFLGFLSGLFLFLPLFFVP